MKIVVARPLDSVSPNSASFSSPEGGPPSTASAEQYQQLNTSLNAKLEFQSAEVDHWKQECDRYKNAIIIAHTLYTNNYTYYNFVCRLKDEMLRYSIAEKVGV